MLFNVKDKTRDRRKCSLFTVEGCSPKTNRVIFPIVKYTEKWNREKVFTMKGCSLIRGVYYERFHCKFLIIFCLKNTQNLTTFQIFWGENRIHNVFLLYVFIILFNNDPQQISINSSKKWPRKWYRNMNFSLKKCIIEKTHLKFCYVYTNNASITQKMRFLYINGFILEICLIYMESLIIYLHRNVKKLKIH